MNEPFLLQRIQLGDLPRPTGRTRHLSGGEILPPPSELRIVKYPNHPGFYLLYGDSNGKELTDTYHESLEKAMFRADWEFEVKPKDWEILRECESLD